MVAKNSKMENESNRLNFVNSDKIIKPQHAVQRLYELTKNQDTVL